MRAASVLAHIGDTPLVPLGPIADGLDVPVLVKCEHLNPGGSVKDRIALAIVADAEDQCPRRCRPTRALR